MTWLNKGVELALREMNVPGCPLPIQDVLYADDTILLGTSETELQIRFSMLERYAGLLGMSLNRDKTVTFLAKVKGKLTLGTARRGPTRLVLPASIRYSDGTLLKTSESEDYLGTRLNRSLSAKIEIQHRIGLVQTSR